MFDGMTVGEATRNTPRLANTVIQSIHENLVEEFEKAGAETHRPPLLLDLVNIVDPTKLSDSINGTNIRIGKFKNMFTMRMFLILGSGSHCEKEYESTPTLAPPINFDPRQLWPPITAE